MKHNKWAIDRMFISKMEWIFLSCQKSRKHSGKNFIGLLTIALFFVPIVTSAAQQPPQPNPLGWAYNIPDKDGPKIKDDPRPKHVPGSSKTYTLAQVGNLFDAPDWFPNEHAPMPQVVQKGSAKMVFACAICHLANGMGHPQSATLAGLPADYLKRQLADFKSGARKDPVMNPLAMNLSDKDAAEAAEWFAGLKPRAWVKVVETSTVPKSFVDPLFMRIPVPGGGTEPLGNRIIMLPQQTERALCRDPHSGFIAYVPKGSIARGKSLVTTGGAAKLPCGTCHGDSLRGMGDAPRIAGLTSNYIVRQLIGIQNGTRAGVNAELMKPVVSHMSKDDMLAIGAYLATLAP